MSNKLVADSDYIQLDDISDNTEMSSLLSARNSRRVSDNSTPENSLQQSIDETVERNPCKRIGLSQACIDGWVCQVEKLLKADPAVCNELDKDGLAPLHHAARGSHLQIIDCLLNAGADIDIVASSQAGFMTPLICASKFDAHEACRLLIQRGAEVFSRCCIGQSPLHYAARKGNLRVIEVLLTEGKVPVNLEDNDKATPLHTAALVGQTQVIHKLIYNGGDLSLRDNDGFTPFHLAAREGHLQAFKDMLNNAKKFGLSLSTLLNSPDNYGEVCLHMAVKNGHTEIVELCLDSGADMSKAQADYSTPIHLACCQGNLDITKMLVKRGAKIECEDGNGLTPLLRASLEGHVPIIEYLLEQGAQLYPTTETCTPSPIMCAVKRSQHAAVKYFLARGFPLDKYTDAKWRTPLHVAVACADLQTVDLLLERGGDSLLEKRDQYGKTAIHYAAATCNVDKLNRLIYVGADVRAKDNDEKIALHFAAENGVICVVKALLSACPESVNDIDYASRTPLHYAARKGRVEACTHLLSNGAAVDYRDDDRHTPLFHAAIVGCGVTTGVLLQYNADINALDKNRKSPIIYAAYFGNMCALRRLIKDGADVTVVASGGYNCLDVAIMSGKKEICMEIIKHDKWREVLSNRKLEGVTPMRRLIEKYPQVAQTVMDKCIEHSSHLDTDQNYSITYDFSFIYPKVGEDIDNKKERYCGAKGGASLSSSHETDRTNEMASSHCSKDLMVPQEYIIAIFCFINLLFEGYQLYNERWMYLDVSNFLEVSTYVTAIATVLPLNGGIAGESDVQWATGVISLLLAFGVMLVQLQLLFCSGIYVTMLIEVLKSVFRVIVVFSVLFLAYGLIFYLLLGDELSYQNTYMSTLKVFDMMAGGIEFNHYFVEKNIPMPDLARFIVFTFIIVMSLSFMNLLIGLAVGDIEAVQKNAEIKRLKTQIEAIHQFEEKLPTRCLEKLYKSRLIMKPNSQSNSFLRKLTWYLGLVDYGHWKMIVGTQINEEDKIESLKGQLSANKDRTPIKYDIAEDGAAFPKDDTREYLKSSWNKADIQPANKPSARAVRLRILQKVDSISHNSSLLKNARDLSTMWKLTCRRR
ncbi:Transient receptor potential cation channel subfamily A member 1 [Acropora cervicornis]|uniref:Transient receptor potential cation channel subfamily A member 1 n=1 Tax=Acropora cervicornis TaxID=6130 RepID=A0AAD9R233_ACRCE|nr:Transient receptor potential cation channel subfamily A member 1 [Acropora cervicornis]